MTLTVKPGAQDSRDYQAIELETERGDVAVRFYPARESAIAALFVGGVGGGWDSPAKGLYSTLAHALPKEHVAALRVRFRQPTVLDEAVFDILTGIRFLREHGARRIALVGHSFGGAAVIQAAAKCEAVATVVTLATQAHGTDLVTRLAPRCSILLIHGMADSILPPSCSEYVHDEAWQPKRLVLFDGAGHGLDEVADQVYAEVHRWLVEKLNAPGPRPAEEEA